MKTLAAVVALLIVSVSAKAAYFDSILSDPAHPKISASMLYKSKLSFDGAESDVAVVFHKADVHETIIPQRLLDAGVKPVSWTLLEIGGGGDRVQAFASIGPGVYVAQTLLGPLTEVLRDAGGNYAKAADLIVSPNGSGVRLGIHWKSNVLENGGLVQFNRMRFAPRYVVGYSYQF